MARGTRSGASCWIHLSRYGIAADNLKAGHIIIADSVNPIALTRRAWRSVAETSDARHFEVEMLCIDLEVHRRRVETRTSDIAGLKLPSWDDVVARNYEPWPTRTLALDTSALSVEESVSLLVDHTTSSPR